MITAQTRQIADRLEDMFQSFDRQAHISPVTISRPNSPTRTTRIDFDAAMAALPKKAAYGVEAISGNKIEGYAAVWNDNTGKPYIDSYNDITVPNSWKDSIAFWQRERQATGRPHLIPHLRNHQNQVGGVMHLAEDSKGIIYQTQLSNTPLAQETWQLTKDGYLGTSYGYDPVLFDHISTGSKRARRLLKVDVHEISSVTFPANPFATATAKNGLPSSSTFLQEIRDMQLKIKASNSQWEAEKKLRYLEQVLAHKERQIDRLLDRIEWNNR